MDQRTRFVIISCPRTGSTHLVDYLDSVTGICCLSEIFRPGEVLLRHGRSLDTELLDVAARDIDPFGWLEQVDATFADFDCFGFKLFPGQQSPLLRHLCADRRWRKIYLWRENFLDQYISFLLAMRHYGEKEWGRVPGNHQLTIMPDILIPDLTTIEMNYIAIEQALTQSNRDDLFALEYEDLGNLAVMQKLLTFLDIPQPAIGELTAQMTREQEQSALAFKRGPDSMARIRNYDEIRSVLQNTRYRSFLRQ